jgi:uncharacterized protein (TIGR00304 family)
MLWIISVLLIITGIYLILSGLRSGHAYEYSYEEPEEEFNEEKKREVKGGGVVLIGPIPIVFGDAKLAVVALILSIVLMAISLIFMFSVPQI